MYASVHIIWECIPSWMPCTWKILYHNYVTVLRYDVIFMSGSILQRIDKWIKNSIIPEDGIADTHNLLDELRKTVVRLVKLLTR